MSARERAKMGDNPDEEGELANLDSIPPEADLDAYAAPTKVGESAYHMLAQAMRGPEEASPVCGPGEEGRLGTGLQSQAVDATQRLPLAPPEAAVLLAAMPPSGPAHRDGMRSYTVEIIIAFASFLAVALPSLLYLFVLR